MKRMMTNDEVIDIVNDTVTQPTLYRNCLEFRDGQESASSTIHCTFNVLAQYPYEDVDITEEDIQDNSGIVKDDMPYLATGHYKTYPIVSIMFDSMTRYWTFYYVASGKLASSYFHVGEQGAFGFNIYSEEIL